MRKLMLTGSYFNANDEEMLENVLQYRVSCKYCNGPCQVYGTLIKHKCRNRKKEALNPGGKKRRRVNNWNKHLMSKRYQIFSLCDTDKPKDVSTQYYHTGRADRSISQYFLTKNIHSVVIGISRVYVYYTEFKRDPIVERKPLTKQEQIDMLKNQVAYLTYKLANCNKN